jgi:hypothetical protein
MRSTIYALRPTFMKSTLGKYSAKKFTKQIAGLPNQDIFMF